MLVVGPGLVVKCVSLFGTPVLGTGVGALGTDEGVLCSGVGVISN